MWKSSEHQKIAESYELKKTLGRGHFAVVKLAHHVVSGKKVAVKVIDKTKMDKISADHLYHEVTCMKLVQHPNVVRLYQVIETSSKLYLILELGDGGDMFDYIMRHDKGLHEDLAKEYFAQIVSAIAYCHKLHVVHRDLKPENVVFFERQGLVKLTDFGFSNKYRPGEKLSTSCGSLAYSAPEILLGEEYDAPAVDVWSLGVILYMLVCGVAPFNEANDSETLINIMDCRYTVLDHVSEECQDLIEKMIIREPSSRLGLDDIVNHPWLTNAKSLQRARRNSLPILQRSSISEELHRRVLKTMISARIADEEEILNALKEDRYDHITSTYFLLAERELHESENGGSNNSSDDEMSDDNEMDCRHAVSDARAIPNKLRPMYPDKRPARGVATLLSISPPCNQATLLPTTTNLPSASTLEVPRRRTRSSSSEESNSSLSTSVERRSNSYIREHLTITPRHGFSVAHGGINALLEEEERSRSQTTTDEENDAGDDIANIVNPSLLANQLQRTLQLKRFKKRKSAPVLNEICEETELENDLSEDIVPRAVGHQHLRGRHSISSSSPTSHIYQTHGRTKEKSAGDEKLNTNFSARPGRPLRRRRSQKSSSSETSDEDSESRHTSRTNLSGVVDNILHRRHDPRDDQDGDAGPGGVNGNASVGSAFAMDQTYVAEKTIDEDENAPKRDGDAGGNGDGGAGKDAVACNTPPLNNAGQSTVLAKKHLQLDGNQSKIVNVFGGRSKSAESHTSSSFSMITTSRSSSSARSSCSSLSSNNRLRALKRSGPWSHKNSSSTRSDTGLVLRYHKNNLLIRRGCPASAKMSRSSSSSSFASLAVESNLRISNSLQCVGSKASVVDPGANSDGCLQQNSRHHRSCSLPRRHKRRKLTCHKNAGDALSDIRAFPTLLSESCESFSAAAAVAQESGLVKRSNLSLASSTCSGSKFVVDPVNELPPSPCLTPLPEIGGKETTTVEHFSFCETTRAKGLSLDKKQTLLNNLDIAFRFSDERPAGDEKKRPHNVLTKLNSWKAPRRHCTSYVDGHGSFSVQSRADSRLIRKVKTRECCAIM